MSNTSSVESSSEVGPQKDRYLFIDAQDVLQLNFLKTQKKEGRSHYKVGEDQFLPLGKLWRRVLKDFKKTGVKIVLLEHIEELPRDKSKIERSPLENLLRRWNDEGACPEIAAKIIYTKSRPEDSLEIDGKDNVYLYRCKGQEKHELSAFFEKKLDIKESERAQHFIITSRKNKTINPQYKHQFSQDWNKKKEKLVDRKDWDSPSFFIALKNIYLQLTKAKVFERLVRFGPIYQGSKLSYIHDLEDEENLDELITKVHSKLYTDEKPDAENFAYLCHLAEEVKAGKFNDPLLIDPDPDFDTYGRPKFKGVADIISKIDKFIPTYKERFDEQVEKLHAKSEELNERGFHYAAVDMEECSNDLRKRFDWFWTLYSYEKSPYMRLFGLLECIEDSLHIFEDAKDSPLKEHRGWLNILCNFFAFLFASLTVIPMIIYCCYYGHHKSKDNSFRFSIQLKTESLKLLEEAEDVIRIPELSR